jgi:hypothetical protein
MLTGLVEKAAARPNLQRLGRNCTAEFVIGVNDVRHHIVIKDGAIVEVLEGPFKMRPYSFSITAPAASWAEFCKPKPAPGFNDVFAMTSYGHAALEGDSAVFLEHLRFFKDILALLREDG